VFSVPFRTLLIVVVLAGLAGVAAAVLPSRRAAKMVAQRLHHCLGQCEGPA
jgi:hypothetical protein